MTESIKELYPYALADGEGVGTAYEYAAKAYFLRPISSHLADLARHAEKGRDARILVAGLNEKYGSSLDFAILAHRHNARILILDDRPEAIDRAKRGIEAVGRAGHLQGLRIEYRLVKSLADLSGTDAHDVVLSCEVLQRLAPPLRAGYVSALRSLGPIGALFVPNSENEAHTKISGLAGLSIREIETLFPGAPCGFADMPPFPPGISRSGEERARASSGLAEAFAMRILDVYCAAERAAPTFLKRRFAHLVCARWGG